MAELIHEITPEMWRLWETAQHIIPGVRLGGIYAFKKGYHNTVINNRRHWPDNNYSIRMALDIVRENNDKARAIDLTMSLKEIIKWTHRMQASAFDPKDDRLASVREFYGTLDGKTVFGLIKNTVNGEWRRSSADKTHLWHGHMGIFTTFVNKWKWLAPIVSVWRGESYDTWKAEMHLPEHGDSGEHVKYFQNLHNRVRNTVSPPSPLVIIDGDYGDKSAAAFADFWRKRGGKSEKPFLGQKITGWLALEYQEALLKLRTPVVSSPGLVEKEEIRNFVEGWLFNNIPDLLKVEGTFTGKVSLDDEPA